MTWTLFAIILAQIEPFLATATDGISAALVTYVSPLLSVGMIAYVGSNLLLNSVSPQGEPFGPVLRQVAIVVGVWIAFLGVGHYTYLVHDFLQVGLPASIERVITGAAGGEALGANSFDAIWNTALVAGLKVYKSLPWTAIGLQFVVVLYWFVALIAIGIGFLIFLVSLVMISLLVAIGPIFVFLIVFPFTAEMFTSWLRGMSSMIVLKLLVVILLTILTRVENTIIAQIASGSLGNGGAAVGGNAVEIGQLLMLLGGVMLFFITGVIASMLPGMAQSLTGGLHTHLDRMVRGALGATETAATGAGEAAAKGSVAAVGSVINVMGSSGDNSVASASAGLPASFSPAGRSLSGAVGSAASAARSANRPMGLMP
jgi:type IV secretion system protein VirB6